VDFAGTAEIAPDTNPLYEFSLRNIKLHDYTREHLELYRRLLERARTSAEADRKQALRARRRGKIDAAQALTLAKRYDDAMVNYYLGIQAYRLAIPKMN
jgi:hypothetical protein